MTHTTIGKASIDDLETYVIERLDEQNSPRDPKVIKNDPNASQHEHVNG